MSNHMERDTGKITHPHAYRVRLKHLLKQTATAQQQPQITGAGVQGLCFVDNFYFKALWKVPLKSLTLIIQVAALVKD